MALPTRISPNVILTASKSQGNSVTPGEPIDRSRAQQRLHLWRNLGMPHVELKSLTQRFGSQTALDGLDLSIEKGELVSLLGPSGCGKTTTIRLIAGFMEPTAGSVWISG